MAGGSDKEGVGPQSGMLGTLLSLLVAERAGFSPIVGADQPELKEMIDQLTRDSVASLREPTPTDSHIATSA